jgi:hypothetical protein
MDFHGLAGPQAKEREKGVKRNRPEVLVARLSVNVDLVCLLLPTGTEAVSEPGRTDRGRSLEPGDRASQSRGDVASRR